MLDEPAGLTKLRELNVRSMAHSIGVRELDRMVHQWPRPTRILGLFDESVKSGVEEWGLCPPRSCFVLGRLLSITTVFVVIED